MKNYSVIGIVIIIMALCVSCEKDEEVDINYPEYRGDHIYTAEAEPTWGESPISTIHWTSDDEIAVFEGSSIKIIDIQSNSIHNNYSAGRDIEYSVISDNNNFIYYSVRISWENSLLYRLDLTSGNIDSILNYATSGNADMLYSGLCVSSDDSKIAFNKSSFIWVYDIAVGNEVQLIKGQPILFSHDNSELLYSNGSPFSIYSYSFESGESKLVLSDQTIIFQKSDFNPSGFINAVKGNGNIFLTLADSEDNFLIYNLTETNPIFIGIIQDVWEYNNMTSRGDRYYGCNFAIDTRNMKLFSWAFDCMDSKTDGWNIWCESYRYNLSCTDLISKGKTRKGNVLNRIMGTTKISPDGTKLAYLTGIQNATYGTSQYKYLYVYNISD